MFLVKRVLIFNERKDFLSQKTGLTNEFKILVVEFPLISNVELFRSLKTFGLLSKSKTAASLLQISVRLYGFMLRRT
jgi:hypothetical protein